MSVFIICVASRKKDHPSTLRFGYSKEERREKEEGDFFLKWRFIGFGDRIEPSGIN